MGDLSLTTLLPASLPPWLGLSADGLPDALQQSLDSKSHRERWKYTKPASVLELLETSGSAPIWQNLPEGVTTTVVSDAGADVGEFAAHVATAPEAVLNLCRQQALLVIDVASPVTDPLVIEYGQSSLPVLLRLEANAELTLVELTNTDADVHQSLWVELRPGSHLNHTRQAFGAGNHWQHLYVHQERDSHYALHNHCAGAALRRQDVHIVSAAEGSDTQILSAAYLPERTHLDMQLTMEHRAPRATSRQRIHNIAANRAKATCNGRIHIHANAAGVDAELNNRNLTLGEAAVINSKPELEIYTDDVKCAHGATVGQLDADHLFYCASRGIDAVHAQRLLSQAFLATCTQGPRGEESRDRFAEYLT